MLKSILNAVTRRSTLLSVLFFFGVTACGGGGSSGSGSGSSTPTLNISASTTSVVAGDPRVTINASKRSVSGVVQWSLDVGSPGTLDANSGDQVFYTPPPAGSISVDTTAKIIATADGLTSNIVIAVGKKIGVFPFVGNANSGYADGLGSDASFGYMAGITSDSGGNLYVSEFNSITKGNTIRKVTPAGMVTTFAGKSAQTGSSDGVGMNARFNNPFGIATDSAGYIYIADTDNHTIRKITPDGNVSTYAGKAGITGNIDGDLSVALFHSPANLAFDNADNLYISDTGNHSIRKITSTGAVSTLTGSPGDVGTDSDFAYPGYMTTDTNGTIFFVADCIIRKVTADAVVSTFAGDPNHCDALNGTGTSAHFVHLTAITSDNDNNLYVIDSLHTIRKITSSGVVSTLVGNTLRGINEVGVVPGNLNLPLQIRYVSTNTLMVASWFEIVIVVMP